MSLLPQAQDLGTGWGVGVGHRKLLSHPHFLLCGFCLLSSPDCPFSPFSITPSLFPPENCPLRASQGAPCPVWFSWKGWQRQPTWGWDGNGCRSHRAGKTVPRRTQGWKVGFFFPAGSWTRLKPGERSWQAQSEPLEMPIQSTWP